MLFEPFFHTFDKKSNIDILDVLSICLDNLQLDGETNKLRQR